VGGDKFDPEPLDKKAFVDILAKWEEGLKEDSYPVLVMENHDQPRALSRFGDRENYPYESATMLAALLYGMRGVPFVYQGQELGLHDPTFDSLDEYRDIETLNAYAELGEEQLWKNLEVFLKAVIPVAKEAGVNMAIHPDDPPWGMFGLPRIITGKKNLERFFNIVPEVNNGLTLCTGSFGANPENDLVDMASSFADRVQFLHLRNIKITGDRQFEEVGHPTACGSIDMYGVAKALVEKGWDGYVRPDHGRMIWGEKGRYGYGLYDRALGAVYLSGLWEAIDKQSK
jgi:mannonate dehydratase